MGDRSGSGHEATIDIVAAKALQQKPDAQHVHRLLTGRDNEYSVHEASRTERLAVDRELKPIGARVVTADVERPASTARSFHIDLGIENPFLPRQRPSRNRVLLV